MRDNSQRGGDADGNAHQVGCANDHPVDEVVNRVGEQVHVADRLNVMPEFERVLVPPEQEFFEHEEDQQTGQDQQRRLHGLSGLPEGLRHQVNEGIAEQAAGGQTHHHKDHLAELLFAERDGGQSNQREQADDEHTGDCV